jgi:DNA-binding CsgD family transcriptional regulator
VVSPILGSAGTWTRERLLADLDRLALRAPSRIELFDEAAARLQRVLPFDGACWHTLDPGSDLVTQHHLQNIEDRFPLIAHNEYAVDDVNKFSVLAASARKAATLRDATGGQPERSTRYRELLAPSGIGSELRCAFVADGATWGALIMIRGVDRPEFDARDAELLEAASALFARGIRRGLVSEACAGAAAPGDAPGVIELDGAGGLVRMSSTAEPLLAELSGTTAQAGIQTAAVQALAAATRAAVAAHAPVLPSTTLRTPAGTWLVLHGALLGSDGVSVFLQRAHPTLIAPLLLQAYGLTPRQQEAAQLMLRGATSDQIAQRLGISPHTAVAHAKAIFEKTGVSTRGELSAAVFFGEHLPRIQADVPVGDDASFVDAPRARGAPG